MLSSCSYSFSASGGFPAHIRTVAVLPFENDTNRFDLTEELHSILLRELPRALGVQNAAEDVADAVVEGSISNYTLQTPLFRRGQEAQTTEVFQRQVNMSIQVRIIDVQENLVLWESSSVTATGQFDENTEAEEDGRAEAIELLVQRIVDGAQSNW